MPLTNAQQNLLREGGYAQGKIDAMTEGEIHAALAESSRKRREAQRQSMMPQQRRDILKQRRKKDIRDKGFQVGMPVVVLGSWSWRADPVIETITPEGYVKFQGIDKLFPPFQFSSLSK